MSYELGNAIRFSSNVKDKDGNIVEPDIVDGDHQIFIDIKDSDLGTTVMKSTLMNAISNTSFYKVWQTTEGQKSGQYEVTVEAQSSGDTILNRDLIELKDIV